MLDYFLWYSILMILSTSIRLLSKLSFRKCLPTDKNWASMRKNKRSYTLKCSERLNVEGISEICNTVCYYPIVQLSPFGGEMRMIYLETCFAQLWLCDVGVGSREKNF